MFMASVCMRKSFLVAWWLTSSAIGGVILAPEMNASRATLRRKWLLCRERRQ